MHIYNRQTHKHLNLSFISKLLPTYPGVPQAVDMTSPVPSILDKPKSLIMIFEPS